MCMYGLRKPPPKYKRGPQKKNLRVRKKIFTRGRKKERKKTRFLRANGESLPLVNFGGSGVSARTVGPGVASPASPSPSSVGRVRLW